MKTKKVISVCAVVIVLLGFASASEPELTIVEETSWTQFGGQPPTFLSSVEIKAILPDGSHALLSCIFGNDKNCGGVPSTTSPEKLPPDFKKCDTQTDAALNHQICVEKNLGSYRFKRSGNEVTIFYPRGKSRLLITGSW